MNYQQPWHVRPTRFQRLKLSFLGLFTMPHMVFRPAWKLVHKWDLPHRYARELEEWEWSYDGHSYEKWHRAMRDRDLIDSASGINWKWAAIAELCGVSLESPSSSALAYYGFLEQLYSEQLGHIAPSPNIVAHWQAQGLDVNATCMMGRTPLHYAVKAMNVGAIRDLLNAGADPVATDAYGDTPLHAVAKFWAGNPSFEVNEAIELLLVHGSDIDQPNDDGLAFREMGDFIVLDRMDRRDRLQEVAAQTRSVTVDVAPRRAM